MVMFCISRALQQALQVLYIARKITGDVEILHGISVAISVNHVKIRPSPVLLVTILCCHQKCGLTSISGIPRSDKAGIVTRQPDPSSQVSAAALRVITKSGMFVPDTKYRLEVWVAY
jgi:hypothetical protein